MAELQAMVETEYGRSALPSWPDPHPGMSSPRREEYSRVTKPERFRIGATRARSWASVLADVPGVQIKRLAPAPLDEDGHLGRFDRGVRLTSSRPGTLPLLLLEQDVHLAGSGATMTVLHISVAEPPIAIDRVPDCGCDACDSGSADLLRQVDEAIGHVVAGPFVVLRSSGWQAQWHPEGASSGGTRRRLGHQQARDLCRRLADGEPVKLPRGLTAFVGRSWLG